MAKLTKAMTASLLLIANSAQGFAYLSAAEGKPLVQAGLVEQNDEMLDPNDNTKVACRLTDAGKAALPKQKETTTVNTQTATATPAATGGFAIITNAVAPPIKRGFTKSDRAPKYPFADMAVGASFFVPNTDEVPDAVKSMGSTVSNANKKYSKPTGQMETVVRTVREGRKAKLDANGAKMKETVQVPVLAYERKFSARPVKGGEKYGEWVAPADGALVFRTQ
jgi:hypothetical protein